MATSLLLICVTSSGETILHLLRYLFLGNCYICYNLPTYCSPCSANTIPLISTLMFYHFRNIESNLNYVWISLSLVWYFLQWIDYFSNIVVHCSLNNCYPPFTRGAIPGAFTVLVASQGTYRKSYQQCWIQCSDFKSSDSNLWIIDILNIHCSSFLPIDPGLTAVGEQLVLYHSFLMWMPDTQIVNQNSGILVPCPKCQWRYSYLLFWPHYHLVN